MDYYILKERTPEPIDDLVAWSQWMGEAGVSRIVGNTQVTSEIRVSTVFLGLDHSFGGDCPLLFETMVFRDGKGCECERCSTWDQAEVQHNRMVENVKQALK